MSAIKLIAFDLDGVLVDGRGSWQEVHNALGTMHLSDRHSEEYHCGKITFDEWAKKDVALWLGIEIEQMRKILYAAKLMAGAAETMAQLKEKYNLVIISGGLQLLADRIKDELGMDDAVANDFVVRDGRVAGINNFVDFEGKGRILKRLARQHGVKTSQCAAVGDYINDIPMFKEAGFSIAFNPKDERVSMYADAVVEGKDLRGLLRFF